MKALVTGGCGFIGSNLCHTLIHMGHSVVCVDDLSTGYRCNLSDEADFEHFALHTDQIHLIQFDKFDVVFHLAAVPRVTYSVENPVKTSMANLGSTWNILDAVRHLPSNKRPRIIFSSSSSIYGPSAPLPTAEDTPANPISPYALQKWQCEEWIRMFCRLYGMEAVCLRYFNVFGPRSRFGGTYSTVLSAWMYHLLVDRSYQPYLEGDGTQSRDFCFIDNVVQANILAAELPILCEGQAYNIAQGHSTSLLECKDLLEEITGEDLVLAQRPQRVGDVAITWANIDKAQRDLGYMPGTNFTEQIIAMATWYRDSYASEVFPGPCGE